MQRNQTAWKGLALAAALLLSIQWTPLAVLAETPVPQSTVSVSSASPAEEESSSAAGEPEVPSANAPSSGGTGNPAATPTPESSPAPSPTPVAATDDADWADTGALHDDGSPVTAGEADTAEASGALTPSPESLTATSASYLVTLQLDGGQANGLQGAGWTQSSIGNYQWNRTVTAATLTVDDTLGGLLPQAPYRAGYVLTGWQIGDVSYALPQGADAPQTASLSGDTAVTALWKETLYTVTFDDGSQTLWQVQMPYGAVLWTQTDSPWESLPEEDWTPVSDEGTPTQWTATTHVTVGDQPYSDVQITRHEVSGDTAYYYYTFTVGKVLYFTYGGPLPTREDYEFTTWKMTAGRTAFTVLQDTTFTAQFVAGKAYIVNVYFYYTDGTRVDGSVLPTQTETFAAQDVTTDGTLRFSLHGKSATDSIDLDHYQWELRETAGVSLDPDSTTVTVRIDEAFADTGSTTNFLALTVLYQPAEITYMVNYYQQQADSDEYLLVGTLPCDAPVPYGSTITAEDRPALPGISFDGFEATADSQLALHGNVVLTKDSPLVNFLSNTTAEVNVYYDRASYFVYFQTGTAEVQKDPIKVQYGADLPNMQETLIQGLHRTGYDSPVLQWYQLAEDGSLVPVDGSGTMPQTMPARDLYAVVHWKPATTSIQIIYWLEGRNSSGFQNAYSYKVDGIPTESTLTVRLDGDTVTLSGADAVADPELVSTGFLALMQDHYGSSDYQTFFSYSAANTKTSPGNVANATATESGSVQNGAITDNRYTLRVNGDGSSVVNVYYTRNLYTLEFVLDMAYTNNQKTHYVATSTPGTFAGAGWKSISFTAGFEDFSSSDVTATTASANTHYGSMVVYKTYQLANADGDDRAAVGRYGRRDFTVFGMGNVTCLVYTLTARFEADIASLWPTAENLKNPNQNGYQFISMGTAQYSYYRQVYAADSKADESNNIQANILNAYSTMDLNLLGQYSGNVSDTDAPPFPSVTADSGNGSIAHQMITYWNTGASEYCYYFLYETLDTTVRVDSPGVTPFSAQKADQGEYKDGDLVSYNGKVYVYSEKETSSQKSTAVRNGQNQPAKQGYSSEGRLFDGPGDKKPDDGNSPNIYFFYSRESFDLTIQNINEPYTLPEAFLTARFDCLDQYVPGADTLKQLGWYYDTEKQTIRLRYGALLSPLQESEILSWLTSADRGKEVLAYPIPSESENQYYFSHWFRNSQQTVRVDWQENDFRTIHANVTLYAGWFTPRYTTSYVLNGGTWQDSGDDAIQYTLITTQTEDGQNLYFYYPHQTTDPKATVYWYVQSVDRDRLYVDTLYTCTIQDVLVKDPSTGHWKLNTPLALDHLRQISTEDLTGTRLVDRYFCYMGRDGLDQTNGHTKYVNINSSLNTVLPEPAAPIRSGYAFVGWYYFDDPTSTDEKVYLKGVLSAGQSLDSYDTHYVYLNSVGDAFLLERDAQGELFYYPSQTGYRFNYSNNASLVSKTRELYAAWESTSDARAVVYQLIRADQIEEAGGKLTPKGGSDISLAGLKTITIGGTEYLILQTDTDAYQNLYTGSTQMLTAWEYCVGGQSRKWLPQYASIPLHIDQSTPTAASPADLDAVTGNTYRIQDRDADGNPQDSYTYYAFFVYEPSQEISYNVYAIDFSVAVAEGDLSGYQDTFDRANPPDPNAPYVLQVEQKSWQADTDSGQQAVVYENAPAISGYSIYSEWSQSLQLQTTAGTNNLYFYYIKDGAMLSYSMTYYLMTEGAYSPEDTLVITGIPAVRGEILSLRDLIGRCAELLEQAVTYRSYGGSEQPAQAMLYDRYQKMTVTLTQGGASQTFTVNSGGAATLDPLVFQQTLADYYLDQWSPSGDTLVASDDTTIDVYLGRAELTVQKEGTDGSPLAGARFTLAPLVKDSAGPYHYGDATYRVADTPPLEAVSGADGRAVFTDLSAQTGKLYLLTEVQAPAGYNKLQEPVMVAVPYVLEGQEPSYQVTYTVVNAGISYLPKAGVPGGIYGTVLLGGGMMAAAVFYLIVLVLLRRRKHRRTKPI